jgi:hypothetical protein
MTRSSKHTPRVDEELTREVEAHLRGSPAGSRVEGWREPEPPVDGEPEVSAVPWPDPLARSDRPLELTPEEVEARSRFSRFLPRTVFPAHRETLVRAADAAGAPDDVIEQLRQLPAGRTFLTAARAWAALGHPLDRRF